MIRIYAYYSCGGYKDMYLGSSEGATSPTYFLPLLPVMKKRGREDDLEKIKYQDSLPQIGIVTSAAHYDFPNDAKTMFSHGAYKAIYRTLADGSSCLAVHDIPSNETDEVGREIPFTIMYVAKEAEDATLLDYAAVALLKDMEEWQHFFSSLFAYDPIVNGIKFDLPKAITKIQGVRSLFEISIENRNSKSVSYLMLNGINGADVALREQNLKKNEVSCIVDTKGNVIDGHLPWVEKGIPLAEEEKTLQDEEKSLGEESDGLLEDTTDVVVRKDEISQKDLTCESPTEGNTVGVIKDNDYKQILEYLRKLGKQLDELSGKDKDRGLDNKHKYIILYLIVITTLIVILQIINLL